MPLPISAFQEMSLRGDITDEFRFELFFYHMKESLEKIIAVGFSRNPKKIFDEVEMVTADMIRQGWNLRDSVLEEGLGKIHLFFERDIAAKTSGE
jgi:hypothetical protein